MWRAASARRALAAARGATLAAAGTEPPASAAASMALVGPAGAAHTSAGRRWVSVAAALPPSTAAAANAALTGGGAAPLVSPAVRSSAATPDAFLSAMPRGAYSNARTVGGAADAAVFELDRHIERVAASGALMGLEWVTPDAMQALVPPACKAALDEVVRANGHLGNTRDAKLTLLAAEDGKLHVHASLLPPVRSGHIVCCVAGSPRENAAAKDSSWAEERQALERSMPRYAEELLLTNESGEVLEGAGSNFFAVAMDGEVWTADEGVLKGSIRDAVLGVCADEGIAVRLSPPKLQDAAMGLWEGALITSTSRLAMPVDFVELGESFGSKQVALEHGGLAHHLARAVAARVQNEAVVLR